jgi:hypothetical protein
MKMIASATVASTVVAYAVVAYATTDATMYT